MPVVRFEDKSLVCNDGDILYRVLAEAEAPLDAPCGGAGTCGKCHVWIDGLGKVKSCSYAVHQDITVHLTAPRSEIEVMGQLRDVPVTRFGPCFAADIGTTTVVVYLIDNGKIIDTESRINAQRVYGADVITRINLCMQDPEGTEILHRAIKNQIDSMRQALCRRNGICPADIAIAGNTTMLHLYANVSPAPIGVAPFTPAFTDLLRIDDAMLLPGISGYVGADTVAAILASGMHLSKDMMLLIDIGTNGEIALGNRDGIVTCATAAGPAFEGAQISCGVGGVAGAINRIRIDGDGKIHYTTIDDQPPIGICGSAILDAAAEMYRTGIIDETGYFEDEILEIAAGITVNDKDIRQIQLAKGAIAAGIQTLLRESGISLSQIRTCYLAGGFGSKLNHESACRIGLLPKELAGKIRPIGNASGMGAALWQISDACRKEVEEIVALCRYFELSDSKLFNEEFMKQMYF